METQPVEILDASPNPAYDRRSRGDRRVRPTPMLSTFMLWGARRAGRRGEEQARAYVDRPGPWVAAAFGAVIALSLADVHLTLSVLSDGRDEANPLMRAALDLGRFGFVGMKLTVTFLCTAFLGLHRNWPLARACLWIAVAAYSLLILYHIYGRLGLTESGLG